MLRLRDLVVLISCALCVWGALCVRAVHVARAQAGDPARARSEPLDALVRLSVPQDEALFGRLRGQSSDLPVRLREVSSGPLEPALHEQLAAARALAEPMAARVVIWTVRSALQLTVVVADLSLGRVLVRELKRSESERDRSAQEEAAALVVRSALKATLAGEPLGAEERELVPEPEPPAAPLPAPPATSPPPVSTPPREVGEAPAAREPKVAWGALLALGMLGSADGATSPASLGLAARVALTRARLELGLRADFGLRASVSAPFARVQLAQHRAGAYVGYSPLQREQLRLSVAATLGANLFTTRVRSEDARVFTAETARSVVPALGAGCLLTYLPRWTRGHAGLAVSAFFEAFPRRLQLGYDKSSTDFVRVARLWPVQPVVALELVLRY